MKTQNCQILSMKIKPFSPAIFGSSKKAWFRILFLLNCINVRLFEISDLQHNANYVVVADFGGFFHSISRIFSILLRCSVPVEMI